MNRAVFLDRDNTIIHNDGDLGDPQQVRLIQGAASAMASLRGLGYKIVVVSNQGGVARGKYTEQDVDAVNARIAQIVQRVSGASIDRFYYCPFHPEGSVRQYKREHPWRKPAPGMFKQAADDLNLDLAQCWTVGDQLRDAVGQHRPGALMQQARAGGPGRIRAQNFRTRRDSSPQSHGCYVIAVRSGAPFGELRCRHGAS